MKKLVAMVLALLMVLISVGIAEEVPFSEWIAGQDPVVTDVFAEEVPTPEVPAPEAPVPEAPVFEPIGVGSRGETVAQLQEKLIELGILDGKADGVFGPASEAAVKYTQKALGWEETGAIQTADELNTILALVPGDGVNLLRCNAIVFHHRQNIHTNMVIAPSAVIMEHTLEANVVGDQQLVYITSVDQLFEHLHPLFVVSKRAL